MKNTTPIKKQIWFLLALNVIGLVGTILFFIFSKEKDDLDKFIKIVLGFIFFINSISHGLKLKEEASEAQ